MADDHVPALLLFVMAGGFAGATIQGLLPPPPGAQPPSGTLP